MKTFRITETALATATWVHYVKAKNEEEAINKLEKNELIDTYYSIEMNDEETRNIENISIIKDF